MLKSIIKEDITKILKNLDLNFDDKFIVKVPTEQSFGDFSCNVAMAFAKKNKLTSGKLADSVKKELLKNKAKYKKVEIVKPGFINIFLSNNVFQEILFEISKQKEDFGKSDFGKGKRVLVEFVSANPTGPLNIVSARAASYGDCLCNVLEYVGYEAFREFYVNDYGNQVDILSESIDFRLKELLGINNEEFPVEAYHGEYIIDLAKKFNDVEGAKIASMSDKERLSRIKSFALSEIHFLQENSLKNFGVIFDNWVSEKVLREKGLIEEVLSYLEEANCTYEKDDAIWFRSTKYGDEKDRVLMKSDGNTTYLVPDIGYHINKYAEKYDIMIDVLGPDHHGYCPRLVASLKALGKNTNKLKFVILQQVTLFEDEVQVKVSKRSGKFIIMDELIKEVGIDATRYFFLDKKTTSHINFDINLAKEKSSQNPVYYCQYAYARICSIEKNAKKLKLNLGKINKSLVENLNEIEEISLIKKIVEFPEILISVAQSLETQKLISYMYDLSALFHAYYEKHKTLNEKEKDLSLARLFLCRNIANILKICFNLTGITALEKMDK